MKKKLIQFKNMVKWYVDWKVVLKGIVLDI